MCTAIMERITEKIYPLSTLDGYVQSPDILWALEDVRLGNVTRCNSVEELFRELEIEV